MTGHPLIDATELAAIDAIRPSTLAAVEYATRGATAVTFGPACWIAAAALAEDELAAPPALRPAIAALTVEVNEWAEAA